jgi:hypothetical protein
MKHRWLPLLGRDLYYLRVSYARGEPTTYLRWLDNDTLFITEKTRTIRPGLVKVQAPTFLWMILNTLRFFRLVFS